MEMLELDAKIEAFCADTPSPGADLRPYTTARALSKSNSEIPAGIGNVTSTVPFGYDVPVVAPRALKGMKKNGHSLAAAWEAPALTRDRESSLKSATSKKPAGKRAKVVRFAEDVENAAGGEVELMVRSGVERSIGVTWVRDSAEEGERESKKCLQREVAELTEDTKAIEISAKMVGMVPEGEERLELGVAELTEEKMAVEKKLKAVEREAERGRIVTDSLGIALEGLLRERRVVEEKTMLVEAREEEVKRKIASVRNVVKKEAWNRWRRDFMVGALSAGVGVMVGVAVRELIRQNE